MTDQFQFENPGDESEQLDQMEPERSLVDRGLEDPLDEGYAPPDHWSTAEKYGTTAREQAEGETLEQRLEQEEPEVEDDWDEDVVDDGEVGADRAGRLVDPNEGIGADVDSDLIGEDVGIDGAGASAEEAAVHVVPEDEL
ncbi:MAG: DUF5709 domain-containing protein [Propionibacteriaceae bacterium]